MIFLHCPELIINTRTRAQMHVEDCTRDFLTPPPMPQTSLATRSGSQLQDAGAKLQEVREMSYPKRVELPVSASELNCCTNTGINFNFVDFAKNASFKSYGVICLLRAALASHCVFFHEISFYASFEACSYIFTAHTTGLWKTACDSLAQTHKWHRYTDHEY